MRVLVTGASGQVGRELVAELEARAATRRHGAGLEVTPIGHRELDLAQRASVLEVLTTLQPDVVFNLAAYTAVDDCESHRDQAFAVNALGVRYLSEGARLCGAHLCHVSTDYVFDGRATRPYLEWDRPNPLSVYGRSKLGGERELDPSATVVRTSWVCGRFGPNMVATILRLAASRSPLAFVGDQIGSPTVVADLVPVLADLGLHRRAGIFHVTNSGVASWYDFARHVVASVGGDPNRVTSITTDELDPPRPAPRPANSVLDNAVLRLEGGRMLPDWHDSVAELATQLQG